MWYWLESNWEFCCLFLLFFLILELIWDEVARFLGAFLQKVECQPAVATAKAASFPPEAGFVVEHTVPPEYEIPAAEAPPKPKKKKRNGWKSKEAPELGEIIDVRDNTGKAWRQRKLISIDDEEENGTRAYRIGQKRKKK
jgi:hypothetical protein